jgi:hypothetical protein
MSAIHVTTVKKCEAIMALAGQRQLPEVAGD